MAMELKLKDTWYWIANFAMLGMCSLSMYMDDPIFLIAIAAPLILIDRAYVIPVFIFIACIEGSFVSEDASSKAETYAIAVALPFFLYDVIKHNKVKVPYKLSLIYIVFGIFVMIGIFNWGAHPQLKKYLSETLHMKVGIFIYIKMFMKIIKLVFFFLYLKVLINGDKEMVYRGLTFIKDMAPYLIGLVLLDMLMFGAVTEKFDTLHFGEAHHGDFSSNMNALGVMLYIGIFEPKTSLFKRFVHLCGLGCLLFVIMNIASRNGLLNFLILGCLGGLIALWNLKWDLKLIIIASALVVVAACGFIFKDSPTIERFIYQTEEEDGGERLAYWKAGYLALSKNPLFGVGGDESASLWSVYAYAKEVDPHVMHNTFLEFAVEYGFVGELFFLIFVGAILVHSFKNFMFAAKYDDILLATPGIAYFISIFAGLFVSRVWESTLWYYMTLVFAVYIVYRKPIEDAYKNRKKFLMHGLPDPVANPAIPIHPA